MLSNGKEDAKPLIKIKSLPKIDNMNFNLSKAIEKNKFLSRIQKQNQLCN